MSDLNRRQLLAGASATAALSALAARPAAADEPAASATARTAAEPFGYCLNTSTIRGQNLSLVEEIDVAAKAGYQAIEPWLREIQAYLDQGGSTGELRRRIEDAGLTVESAIGFAAWIVDDEKARSEGLETARRDMELVKQIGGKRIAAPPVGATNQSDLNLMRAAERYAVLLDLGREIGVVPQIEVWGFSKSLSRLGETMYVAVESGRRDACILPDVYHIYKGGSDFAGMSPIDGRAIHVFHVNDYPADPPRDRIGDADRVYPGDGVAPLKQIFTDLYANGFRGYLSLELFNKDYWKQDALTVAKTGLEKTRAAVRQCNFA